MDMEGIAFCAKDGMCPRFEAPNGDVYLIQDKKEGADYQYALHVKRYETEIKTFSKPEEADEYVKSKTDRKSYQFCDFGDCVGYLFFWGMIARYGLTVKTIYKPDIISEWFESYADCLQYAKDYVSRQVEQMRKEQERQINLLDLFG